MCRILRPGRTGLVILLSEALPPWLPSSAPLDTQGESSFLNRQVLLSWKVFTSTHPPGWGRLSLTSCRTWGHRSALFPQPVWSLARTHQVSWISSSRAPTPVASCRVVQTLSPAILSLPVSGPQSLQTSRPRLCCVPHTLPPQNRSLGCRFCQLAPMSPP